MPTEEKDKIVKEYEKKKDKYEVVNSADPAADPSSSSYSSFSSTSFSSTSVPQPPKIEEAKELTEEEANQRIE